MSSIVRKGMALPQLRQRVLARKVIHVQAGLFVRQTAVLHPNLKERIGSGYK